MEPTGPCSIWCWVIANSAVVRDLGSIILAVLGLGLLTWRSRSAERHARASQTQADLAQEQISLARHDSLTDRYQKASDMLGSDLLSVRLGGIYGLCQLAQDHPKEFHLRVVNLLAAFVRHPPPIEPAATESAATEEARFSVPVPRRDDIQEIIDFFGKRSTEGREIEKAERYTINLKGSNLNGIDFSFGFNLKGIELKLTNLTRASFIGVQGLALEQLWGAGDDDPVSVFFSETHDSETGASLDDLVLRYGSKPRLASTASPSASPPPDD